MRRRPEFLGASVLTSSVVSTALQAAKDAQQVAATTTYQAALNKLAPTWSALPQGPYPPSGDTTPFPRTGDSSLIVSASKVSADQLAEPGKVTEGLYQQSLARRPTLSPLFWIGAACLGGYLVLR